MTRKEAITVFLVECQKALIEDQRAKKIRASGRSAASLHPITQENSGQLLGLNYFYFQQHGRSAGKRPPIEAIIQWLKDKKGFNVAEDKGNGLRSLAFAIANKIANKGTDIKIGKRPGLSIEDKITDFRKELAYNVMKATVQQIKPVSNVPFTS